MWISGSGNKEFCLHELPPKLFRDILVISGKKVKRQELAFGWVEHNKKGNSLSRRKKSQHTWEGFSLPVQVTITERNLASW
jgi:hypothetical protein